MTRDIDEELNSAPTFWDWFKLGCVLGLIYHSFRNPGALACLVGCVGLLVLLVGAVVAAVIWPYRGPALLVVAVVLIWWYYVRPRGRQR